MLLIDRLDKGQLELYLKYIKAIASLSGLYSESKIPFLHYRTAEKVFCRSFKAEDLSRLDVAYDAKLKSIGIGLKTFIVENETSREKIAEFNTHSKELRKNKTDELLLKLAELRNERIDFANRTYGISNGIYHCLARQPDKIKIFETDYHSIDIASIKNVRTSRASIFFEDKHCEYSFNFSKSTLYRKFYTLNNSISVNIKIINDPYELILKLFSEYSFQDEQRLSFIILPLYSTRNRGKEKEVPQKSGLNQWNAGGRQRNLGEVYIPIPKTIHRFYPNFFPPRDHPFTLILPTHDSLKAKICQEGGKALMSNPNKALSEWLLRRVLKLKLGEILTYQRLKTIGVDSVKLTKLDEGQFKINFAKMGSYEEFEKISIAKNI